MLALVMGIDVLGLFSIVSRWATTFSRRAFASSAHVSRLFFPAMALRIALSSARRMAEGVTFSWLRSLM